MISDTMNIPNWCGAIDDGDVNIVKLFSSAVRSVNWRREVRWLDNKQFTDGLKGFTLDLTDVIGCATKMIILEYISSCRN